jgi:hypothetical protein
MYVGIGEGVSIFKGWTISPAADAKPIIPKHIMDQKTSPGMLPETKGPCPLIPIGRAA